MAGRKSDACRTVSHAAFCNQRPDRSEADRAAAAAARNSITRSQTLEVNKNIWVVPHSQPYLLHPGSSKTDWPRAYATQTQLPFGLMRFVVI